MRPRKLIFAALASAVFTLASCGGNGGGGHAGSEASVTDLDSLSAADKATVLAALETGVFDEAVAAEKAWLYNFWYRLWTQKQSTLVTSGTTTPPTTNQPTTNQPTTNQPTTNQPTTNQPTTNQPTASTARRLQKADLVYVGAFRVPRGSSDTTSFNYGGTALGFNAANNSLFMTGHDWYQSSAEISIPEVIDNPNITGLATATLLQSFADPTEGKLRQINPSDSNSKKIGGHLVYNGNLYVTGWSYYDGSGKQSASHFRRPLSLSSSGQVVGPVRVGSQYPGYVHGFMATIPPEWQSAFGGPALTGHGGASIASIQSNGPAASVFDPAKIGSVNPVPATPVVGYPIEQSLARRYGAHESGAANRYWLLTDSVKGAAFPVGTRSVLFFGQHGQGDYCYGSGGSGGQCNDPADSSKGGHAYPYAYQVWAYDANDLLAVKEGRKQQYEILPYAVWTFDLPYAGTNSTRQIGGVAYDSATGRIYIAQRCGDTNCSPVIHVMRVGTSSAQ